MNSGELGQANDLATNGDPICGANYTKHRRISCPRPIAGGTYKGIEMETKEVMARTLQLAKLQLNSWADSKERSLAMTTKPLVFGDVKPSKGPWRKEGSGMHASVKDADGFIVAVRHRLPGNEHEANVDLIADAGTTYNATGLTPSQLAEEVERLRAVIFTNTNRQTTMENRFFVAVEDGFISDENFDFDAGLKVSGDFVGDEKQKYAQMIACALNQAARADEAQAAIRKAEGG